MGTTLTALCLLLCLTGWIHAAETNRLSSELVIPQSLFVSEGELGRDPFFPNSARLHKKAAEDPGKSQPVRLDFSRLLRLTGITGGAKPIANINNLTFAVGEEQEVKIEGGKVKIRVVEIREKSVTVSVENQSEPIVLNLRDVQLDFTRPSQ
jgi:hypothetical protein